MRLSSILKLISLVWYIAVYLVRILGVLLHIVRVKFSHKPTSARSTSFTPIGVTILRPLLGTADSNILECLRSTFIQSYPSEHVEIIMCVADSKDPAIGVARALMEQYPHVNAKLLVGDDRKYGINPKVCNLIKGYKEASYDLIWALDSNVCMDENALVRAVPLFNQKAIQLVHHLPIALAESVSKFGGLLDEIYMLTAHSTFYTGINAVGIAPCVTGKSNMYRKSDLDASVSQPPGCGLQQFAKFMAEDQMISESLWKQGGRTAIAPDGAIQPLGSSITVKEFWRRRSRWIRLRKYMVTSATLVEPFTDCIFGTAFFTIVCRLSWLDFMVLCLLWLGIDYLNYRVLLKYTNDHPRGFGQWVIAWLTRELIAFPLWLWAMSGRRIWWRNHYYKIKPDLEAVTADET